MIEPNFYYLDEAAKKLGFTVDGQEAWKNPLIRLGAYQNFPVYLLSGDYSVHQHAVFQDPAEASGEIVEDRPAFSTRKLWRLDSSCLTAYAENRKILEADAIIWQGYKGKGCIRGYYYVVDPFTGRGPLLKDSVMVVLPEDLKRLQVSDSKPKEVENTNAENDDEAFISDLKNKKGDRQELAFFVAARELKIDPKAIPRNGKADIEKKCSEKYPALFDCETSFENTYKRLRDDKGQAGSADAASHKRNSSKK